MKTKFPVWRSATALQLNTSIKNFSNEWEQNEKWCPSVRYVNLKRLNNELEIWKN